MRMLEHCMVGMLEQWTAVAGDKHFVMRLANRYLKRYILGNRFFIFIGLVSVKEVKT